MKKGQQEIDSAFSRREVARRLGVSLVTIDREIARGNIGHFRSGRRVLFTESHLQEYIRLNEIKPKIRNSDQD